jgi:hypothetical protein
MTEIIALTWTNFCRMIVLLKTFTLKGNKEPEIRKCE